MKLAILAFTLSLAATGAWAHPGPHEMEDAASALHHVLSAPDHTGWLILGGIVVATLIAARAAARIARVRTKNRS